MLIKTITRFLPLFLMLALHSFAQKKYLKTDDGVIVYPDAELSGNTKAVKLQVIADNIIRVTASPLDNFLDKKSLITVYTTPTNAKWNVEESAEKISIKTNTLTAAVNLNTGAVSFVDNNGKSILNEKQMNGRSLDAAVFEGEPLYHIRQTFETTSDDAYYGLGQHQSDVFNYKGQQVFFFQNNTEVAIPFLISSKNYGILWDNYSLSCIGDARPYQPLSSLKLFSKDGEEGWLTAAHCNDKNNPLDVVFERAASEINYEYLNDTKLYLPSEFKITDGLIRWEGSIASSVAGEHKFRFTYAGYAKVWIDGKLLMDRWRQPWNPGNAVFTVNMEKDKRYAIKIEWIPDGGESYLSAKCLTPVPEDEKNDYTFLCEAGKQLDYYFIYGKNMDDVIGGYRTLTGKANIVPKWALGLSQSRERYKTQDEILNTVDEFRKRKIPLDNIVEDWSYWKEDAWGSQEFDPTRFSNPDSMIKVLHEKYHTHFMISVWPKL